jgi:hypothetical protein
MIDFFLRFASEAEAHTALEAFFHQPLITIVDGETGETTMVADGDAYLVMNTPDYAIDLVGEIFEPTGTMLEEDGVSYPEVGALEGWHVNIRLLNGNRLSDLKALSAYHVTPQTPHRVWA